MKYFTSDWLGGKLSDEEFEEAPRRYAARIREIISALPPPVAELATEVNLHDALIRRIELDRRASVLVLELVTGDQQVGYSDTEITYGDVDLAASNLDNLSIIARDRRSELVADEVDHFGDSRFEHRLFFTPDAEVDVIFSRLALSSRPRKNRAVPFLGDPFVEVEDLQNLNQ